MCEPKHCGNLLDPTRYRKIPFPYQIERHFDGEDEENMIHVGPQDWCLPKKYEKECDILYNFEVRPDDVWIVSFPYSGVALIQEMIWALTHNCDLRKTEEETLDTRSPFYEASIYIEDEIVSYIHRESSSPQECLELLRRYTIPRWQVLRDTTKRRIIKTHLPLSLLPHSLMQANCKVIYVARNPKDVILSAYLNSKSYQNEPFETFFKKFQQNKKYCCPYWPHIFEAWQLQNNPNFLFMWHDDAVKNIAAAIKTASNFLGVSATEEQLNKLEQHLHIESFKTKARLNQAVLKNFVTCGEESDMHSAAVDEDEVVIQKIEKWAWEEIKETSLVLPS